MSLIEWFDVKEKLPENNDECLIYSEKAGHVIGPIIYKSDGKASGMWIDLFGPYASREAGACFIPGDEGGPTHWAKWNAP